MGKNFHYLNPFVCKIILRKGKSFLTMHMEVICRCKLEKFPLQQVHPYFVIKNGNINIIQQLILIFYISIIMDVSNFNNKGWLKFQTPVEITPLSVWDWGWVWVCCWGSQIHERYVFENRKLEE